MNRRMFLSSTALLLAAGALPGIASSAFAAGKPVFKVGVSIYAGWMPWYFANETGILKKWADKYSIALEMEYMDYGASLDAFNAGSKHAVVMTNMDALDMPAAAGVDSSAIIMGDYSNGNDALLVRNGLSIAGIKGKPVMLVEKTVSQYLLERALQSVGMDGSAVSIVNVSDADIAQTYLASTTQQAVVTWNPMVMEIEKTPGITKLFDSSKIPGEIQDLMVVNTKVLNANPSLGRALTGAWYEVMHIMSQRGSASADAIAQMASLSKASVAEFKGQIDKTALYYTPTSAADYVKSAEIKDKMNMVRQFCFKHNLLGDNAPSVDVVGISYPDGSIQGDPRNVKLRYVSTFMEEAAAGKL